MWLSETLPSVPIEALKRIAATTLARPRLFEVQARSLKKLAAAGVRIGFGTDAGIGAPYGWSAHAEIADMVAAGMTPAQVIVAATRTSAEILRLDQLGTSPPARAPTSSCSTPIRSTTSPTPDASRRCTCAVDRSIVHR